MGRKQDLKWTKARLLQCFKYRPNKDRTWLLQNFQGSTATCCERLLKGWNLAAICIRNWADFGDAFVCDSIHHLASMYMPRKSGEKAAITTHSRWIKAIVMSVKSHSNSAANRSPSISCYKLVEMAIIGLLLC